MKDLTRITKLLKDPRLSNDFKAGFALAVEMVEDDKDRYGIGSMCTQWRACEVAEDLVLRLNNKDY